MKKISTELQEKLIAFGMIMMLCVIIIPLLIMEKYNFPCGDDYAFAITAGHTYGVNHGLFKNILLQFSNTYHEYLTWQGTYSQKLHCLTHQCSLSG